MTFSAATLSPVKMDSLIIKLTDSMILASAGTLSPDSKNKISPTATSADSISTSFPSRNTFTYVFIILARLSALLFAFHSCTVPRMASHKIINRMTMASTASPTKKKEPLPPT